MMEENDDSKHHSVRIVNKIQQFFFSGQLCDVILVADGHRIPAHRLVLSAVSDYFAAMFTSDVREAEEKEIRINDVDPDCLETLVHYIYSGRLDIQEETVENLLSAARLIQLPDVSRVCCDFMTKQLHPSNCIGIRQFAELQGCTDLYHIANQYLLEHFVDVVLQQEFHLLSCTELISLLSSDDINVPDEEIVFEAFNSWLRHDFTSRRKHMSQLLSHIRLPLLSRQFIADKVATNELLKPDGECQELVLEAIKYHLLPERRSQLQNNRTRPRHSTVGSLYAIGGMDCTKGATSVEMYDVRTNSWSTVANMSGRRLQFGIAVINGCLYVVGGRDGLKTLNSVECFDTRLKTWTPMTPMVTHRHGLGVGVLEGPMYAVGGHDGWSYLNTVERWDPQTKQWSYVASMSTARSTVGVAVLQNKLYAVGGRDGGACLRSVECFDPHTNKWSMCSHMSKRRGGVGVAACNGFLYAVGGHDTPACNPASSRFDSVERYDPKIDMWTIITSISSARDAVGCCVLADKLYAVGGYDGQQYLSDVEYYDAQTNEWTKVAPLCIGRAGACVVHVPVYRVTDNLL